MDLKKQKQADSDLPLEEWLEQRYGLGAAQSILEEILRMEERESLAKAVA